MAGSLVAVAVAATASALSGKSWLIRLLLLQSVQVWPAAWSRLRQLPVLKERVLKQQWGSHKGPGAA